MRTASRPFSLGVIKCASAAANVWRDSARLSARAFFDAQHAFVAPMQGIGSRLGTDPTGVMPRRNVWFAGALTVSKPQPVPCSTAPALPPLACAPIYPGRAGPGGLAGPLSAMDGAHEPPWVKAHCSRGTASHAAERPAASGWAGPRSGVYGVSRQPTRAGPPRTWPMRRLALAVDASRAEPGATSSRAEPGSTGRPRARRLA